MPKACLSRDITITMRTKEVIIKSRDGNKVKTVMRARSCKVKLYLVAPFSSWRTLTIGNPVSANKEGGKRSPVTKIIINLAIDIAA